MKTLYLLRHAKSSRDDLALADHERPLARRGRAAAKAIAKYMKREKIAPDIVLCSTSLRTRETLRPIVGTLEPPKVLFEHGIYEAAHTQLLQHLRALPEDANAVLMVGHNPGLHELALALANDRSRNRLPPIDGKFPTGVLVTFTFDGAWKDLRPKGAEAIAFVQPKEIK
ncbi:MAG TPA: histidine phosphatase family protein [Stellaceae bacterium]|nr:histidine phosphatase family protein [Stellaceae bacterium]